MTPPSVRASGFVTQQDLTHSGVAEALTAAAAKLLLRDAASDIDPV